MKKINLFTAQLLVAVVLLNVSGCRSAQTDAVPAPKTVESPKPAKTEISRETLIERLGKKGVQIKADAPKEEFPKPNPLFLLVSVTQGGSAPKYKINQDGEFTADEFAKKLDEIFKMRERQGVLREKSNEVEKTITLSGLPKQLADYKAKGISVEDVETLVDRLKSAGAAPIVLDFTLMEVAEAENLDEPPPPPSKKTKP